MVQAHKTRQLSGNLQVKAIFLLTIQSPLTFFCLNSLLTNVSLQHGNTSPRSDHWDLHTKHYWEDQKTLIYCAIASSPPSPFFTRSWCDRLCKLITFGWIEPQIDMAQASSENWDSPLWLNSSPLLLEDPQCLASPQCCIICAPPGIPPSLMQPFFHYLRGTQNPTHMIVNNMANCKSQCHRVALIDGVHLRWDL